MSKLRDAQQLAIYVLIRLEALKWSYKDLAKKLGVKTRKVKRITKAKCHTSEVLKHKIYEVLKNR